MIDGGGDCNGGGGEGDGGGGGFACGGEGDGGGGEGGGGGVAIATDGVDSTSMPSSEDAVLASGSAVWSAATTSAGVVVDGTAIVAVMSTDAAATSIVTDEASTPAREAIEASSDEVCS